ncbi:MAG: helix-turn-helix domain-containing protein [Actinomycetia bacterium]|nr:helix-turn-helix domain-containing protein [Actinomycetes bacterium]
MPQYLSADEVAAALKTQTPVVYGWIKSDGLPAHRVGRRWLVDPNELDDWVRARSVASPPGLPPASDHEAAPKVDPEWIARQLANFTPDDLRRVGRIFSAIAAQHDAETA